MIQEIIELCYIFGNVNMKVIFTYCDVQLDSTVVV